MIKKILYLISFLAFAFVESAHANTVWQSVYFMPETWWMIPLTLVIEGAVVYWLLDKDMGKTIRATVKMNVYSFFIGIPLQFPLLMRHNGNPMLLGAYFILNMIFTNVVVESLVVKSYMKDKKWIEILLPIGLVNLVTFGISIWALHYAFYMRFSSFSG